MAQGTVQLSSICGLWIFCILDVRQGFSVAGSGRGPSLEYLLLSVMECASQLFVAVTKHTQFKGGEVYFGSRFQRVQSMVGQLQGRRAWWKKAAQLIATGKQRMEKSQRRRGQRPYRVLKGPLP